MVDGYDNENSPYYQYFLDPWRVDLKFYAQRLEVIGLMPLSYTIQGKLQKLPSQYWQRSTWSYLIYLHTVLKGCKEIIKITVYPSFLNDSFVPPFFQH